MDREQKLKFDENVEKAKHARLERTTCEPSTEHAAPEGTAAKNTQKQVSIGQTN
jgi:hypothetical protein